MNYYKVDFFKMKREENKETGKSEKTGEAEYVGTITIDDHLTKGQTLMGKAFRWAAEGCLNTDKVTMVKL